MPHSSRHFNYLSSVISTKRSLSHPFKVPFSSSPKNNSLKKQYDNAFPFISFTKVKVKLRIELLIWKMKWRDFLNSLKVDFCLLFITVFTEEKCFHSFHRKGVKYCLHFSFLRDQSFLFVHFWKQGNLGWSCLAIFQKVNVSTFLWTNLAHVGNFIQTIQRTKTF